MGFGIYCILLREDIFVEINNDTHFEIVFESCHVLCCWSAGIASFREAYR